MDEDFADFVDQIDRIVDGGRADGGLHDRGLPQALIRMRGGAVTTRLMTATATATENAASVEAVPAPRFPGQGVQLGQYPPLPPGFVYLFRVFIRRGDDGRSFNHHRRQS
mmetsp:Transcript_19167/g.29623  ORF Transcript_19167/g.29623 Transcript_19167/m.29623 type:complete len:110 (+) Transcript_19167:86-415(+)